jgi:hypothetical protein
MNAATSVTEAQLDPSAELPGQGVEVPPETVPASRRNQWVWLLLMVLALAALPRLWALMSSGFRGDEAVYSGQAGVLAGDHDLHRYFVLTSRGNSNFLLYQELVAVSYFLFGVSDLAARLVSVVFSIGTVAVTFELARLLYGRRVAVVSAIAVALSGYAVMLGRLALLDSTLTFFFTLTLLAFAKWFRSGSRGWLVCAAASASLTMQAKVTGVLVLLIAVIYMLMSRETPKLRLRDLGWASLAFLICMTPVFVQFASDAGRFLQFLHDSSARVTNVSWHYYLDKLGHFNGYPMLIVWAFGIAVALRRRKWGDRLLLICVGVLGVFFQFYPLKAFNYLLPAIPPLSILGARGLCRAFAWLASPARRSRGSLNGSARTRYLAAPLAASAVLLALCLPPVLDAAQSDSYYGLREAAKWLKRNTPRDAGVMTLSKGSAQYALSFYAHRDSYPFGRFRLATVFPGPKVRSPRPDPQGGPSRDWIDYWPPRLIQSRRVSYLVYYTDEGDDPPEAPIVESEQQTTFRNFIEAYGGELLYTVRRQHEGRAWIYRITKLLDRPRVTFARRGERLVVKGNGFRFNSRVKIYYHRVPRGYFGTDRDGSFEAGIRFPFRVSPAYWLVAIDDGGSVAAGTGLTRSGKVVQVQAPKPPPPPEPAGGTLPLNVSGPLNVQLKVPRQVPVGSGLPIVVHVQTGASRSTLVARANVSLLLRSQTGSKVISTRVEEQETNQLGDAYFNLAALELPGYYKLAVTVEKGRREGSAGTSVKVRRR